MSVVKNGKYRKLIEEISQSCLVSKLEGKTIIVTGATGMIGSSFIDVIMFYNKKANVKCKVVAIGRDIGYAYKRFEEFWNEVYFEFVVQDVTMAFDYDEEVDYIIHGASNTHPVAYAKEPINTILSNVYGADNLLKIASKHTGCRLLFLSSVEIYGENVGDVEYFNEDYCGYINCNTLRAGYPEAKRAGEALCQAYIKEKKVDAVILRLPRSYGPTIKKDDSRAISQFLEKGVKKEDIILKSAGNQKFSYGYTIDEIYGILYVLLFGKTGEAYNLADSDSDIELKNLATYIAKMNNLEVVYKVSDEVEKKGVSTVTKSLMNGDKLKMLGWRPKYNIETGIKETMDILSECMEA